jgi:hypothetical protein
LAVSRSCSYLAWLKGSPSDIRPRAFPLGLLAPRLLCAVLILASIAYGLSGSGTAPFGERKLSSPQRRAPPRNGDLEYSVLECGYWFTYVFASVFRAFGVRPRTTPLLVFISELSVSLSLLYFHDFVRDGAHIQPCHSGNARGPKFICPCPSRPCADIFLLARKRRSKQKLPDQIRS